MIVLGAAAMRVAAEMAKFSKAMAELEGMAGERIDAITARLNELGDDCHRPERRRVPTRKVP